MEYAFVFERPVIYIDVPQKIMNDEMEKIPLIPLEVSIREKIGFLLDIKKLEKLPEIIHGIDNERSRQIKNICSETVFNIGKSAEVGPEYIKKVLDG